MIFCKLAEKMETSYNYRHLNNDGKRRYQEKLCLGLDTCVYEIPSDSWRNKPFEWPSLELPEVYYYLLQTPGVFTWEAIMQNGKSLEVHNQFLSGWVRTVFHLEIPNSNLVVMKAEFMPSRRLNEKPQHSLGCKQGKQQFF